MGSPYPIHYTLRWPIYYCWPSTKNHAKIARKPIQHHFLQKDTNGYLRLIFCGDIMLTQKDVIPVLHPQLCQLLNSADLFIGNCEAPVGKHRLNPKATYHLKYHMPELFLRGIMQQLKLTADQWILSVANNHAGDKGRNAYFESLTILNEMGVNIVGQVHFNGLPLTIVKKNGVNIGLVAWTHWMNCEVFSSAEGVGRLEHIRHTAWHEIKMKHQLDILIGYPHWEYEFQHFPQLATRQLAKQLIDYNGFDMLLGVHAHTLQPMEWFNNGICLYNLGNFCGLGMSWPVRLISLLEVHLGSHFSNKGKMLGYQLHLFVQENEKNNINILPLDEINPRLREKLLKRLSMIFQI